jgi:hypothetical protein
MLNWDSKIILYYVYMQVYIIIAIVLFCIWMYFVREGFAVRPPMPNFGTNTWKHAFDNSQKEFDKRYKIQGEISYPVGYTMTGEFIDYGPLASNEDI